MKKPSEPGENWDALRDKIIGLGEGSIRKSYYPELQQRLAELERFRALLDQSNDAIFLIQLPTQLIVDANESACQQLGYTREELLNQPIDQLGSTDLASWLGAQSAPPTGDLAERETFETVLRLHDGGALPVEVTARRVAFQDVDYAVIVARDMTERQQAEREIVRLNRLYAVLSDINQAIVRTRDQSQLFDAACHIAVEKGQFRLVGVGRVDDRTHTVQLMASAGDRAERLESLLSSGPTATVIQEGRSFLSNDLEHAGLPGPWREIVVQQDYHSLAILPLIVFDRVWGVIQFYSSEPAFFDEQEVRLLIELAADLAYAVESLQRDEQRRQAEAAMRQAQKMESIGVLAGGIAHDFNNLLVAMLGQTSLALEQLPAESIARNHIEKAAGAARRAADLTRQLLAYSGRGQFQIAPLNLNTLIQENLHLFEVAIPKNVRLVSDLMAALPFIDGDVGQMQQVVMNLIINAAEAIGLNPGTVSIATNLYDVTPADDDLSTFSGLALSPGPHVTLSVQDNGSGMDAATLARVFDPFFTTKVTGRGLGLAAVLGIIRSHRGGLRVESAVGQGTTFTLYFPVSAAQPTAPSLVALDQPAVGDSGLVLVIDDEEAVREAVADILEAAGYSVISAINGEAGLAAYRERQTDIQLVLLDLSMPGLSGEATLHQLRDIAPQAVVLLSSGYHPSEVARRFSDYGSVGFLQKPYDVGTLIREVRRHIGH